MPVMYDTRSMVLRPNLQRVRESVRMTSSATAAHQRSRDTVKPRYLSLRLPNKRAPNITPTKKMVAVALFFPL